VHRNMYALVVTPEIMRVGVQRHGRAGRQTHQPRSADDTVERCHDLSDIRCLLQPRVRFHGTGKFVVLFAVLRNQYQSGVSLESRRMWPPFAFAEPVDFVGQFFRINRKRQFYERWKSAHELLGNGLSTFELPIIPVRAEGGGSKIHLAGRRRPGIRFVDPSVSGSRFRPLIGDGRMPDNESSLGNQCRINYSFCQYNLTFRRRKLILSQVYFTQ